MKHTVLLLMASMMLASCGVKRPLVAPKDAAAYEAKRLRKQQELSSESTAVEPVGPVHTTPPGPDSSAPASGPGAISGGL